MYNKNSTAALWLYAALFATVDVHTPKNLIADTTKKLCH